MIRRVAVAISGAPFPSKRAMAKARVAIKALRDPTLEMLAAASETPGCKALDSVCVLAHVHGHSLPDFEHSPIYQAYQAMIDKVLEE